MMFLRVRGRIMSCVGTKPLSDLAEYEMEDGWYSSCNIIDQDFGGMPNPLDHIDLNSLGEALSEKWDDGVYYRLSDDSVITTNCRWE